MRDKELIRQRDIDLKDYFNAELSRLKSDPDNKLVPVSTLHKMATARTGAKFYLSIRAIEHVLYSKEVAAVAV
ncbi:hypothetical protein [Reichenbachiella sp.]|uniref:hypothetical protein n=1 Tax=Reichenbachiella sp. TaxID=2184521 RepID=UPI003B5A984F